MTRAGIRLHLLRYAAWGRACTMHCVNVRDIPAMFRWHRQARAQESSSSSSSSQERTSIVASIVACNNKLSSDDRKVLLAEFLSLPSQRSWITSNWPHHWECTAPNSTADLSSKLSVSVYQLFERDIKKGTNCRISKEAPEFPTQKFHRSLE